MQPDVTNASRNLTYEPQHRLDWDRDIPQDFSIPIQMLPKIRSSSEVYGSAKLDAIKGVPVVVDLGDQQAAWSVVGFASAPEGQKTICRYWLLLADEHRRELVTPKPRPTNNPSL